MDAHLIDSEIYRQNWSTDLSHSVFAESARLSRWLHILQALASAQAACGIIPAAAANDIAALAASDLSIERIATRTRETSHSTLGLIDALRDQLPEESGQFVYFGTTVQDLTDTSLAIEAKLIGNALLEDLAAIEERLLALAVQHADTPMAGRTHGQPGSPISFGYKAATWVDELGRQAERLRRAVKEVATGQLGGAVGTLGFFGVDALRLRATFCESLDLDEPDISWLTSRDRVAAFAAAVSMTCSSLARVANEVYSLQRGELGELAEASPEGTVGSITMPQKRNPESSEQVVTLARLVRAQAGVIAEGMVSEHERDARSWKAEWVALPTLCHYATAATLLSRRLVDGLEVNPAAMKLNLERGGLIGMEQLLAQLSGPLGKHTAQALLQEANAESDRSGASFADEIAKRLPEELREGLVSKLSTIDTGSSRAMVDAVVRRAAHRRTLAEGERNG